MGVNWGVVSVVDTVARVFAQLYAYFRALSQLSRVFSKHSSVRVSPGRSLQVRHPLDTVAYLAAKSASPEGTVGVDCGNARNQLATVTSLFPSKVIQQHLGDPHRGSTSTIVGEAPCRL